MVRDKVDGYLCAVILSIGRLEAIYIGAAGGIAAVKIGPVPSARNKVVTALLFYTDNRILYRIAYCAARSGCAKGKSLGLFIILAVGSIIVILKPTDKTAPNSLLIFIISSTNP